MNLPEGPFGLIMADPPWYFSAGPGKKPPYPTMRLAEIKALPIRTIAAPECALFLWTSGPFLVQSLEVMKAWGFRYVSTAFVWIKVRNMNGDLAIGTGYTTRKAAEFCLLGKRGQPKRLEKYIPEVIVALRREHSRKPDVAYNFARRLYPGPCLDLFSREARGGWAVWGDEVGKFDRDSDYPAEEGARA